MSRLSLSVVVVLGLATSACAAAQPIPSTTSARESSPTISPNEAVVSTPNEDATYEAVFLRLEVVDGASEVTVIGVNAEGRERQIARLPGAWVAYHIRNPEGFLAPTGAVSVGGLLAIPSHRGEQVERAMHWEIYDLHLPDAKPIVIPGITQDVELIGLTPYFSEGTHPSVFWGPGERLAIPWNEHIPDPADPRASFRTRTSPSSKGALVPSHRSMFATRRTVCTCCPTGRRMDRESSSAMPAKASVMSTPVGCSIQTAE